MKKARIPFLLTIFLTVLAYHAKGQESVIRGRIYNIINNASVPFALVVLKDGKENYPAYADSSGKYQISIPKPGFFNIEVIASGYKTYNQFEIELNPKRIAEVNIPLESTEKNLGEVTITSETFVRKVESPLSMRSIGVAEIKRNPGGNRDISKVLQSLPGVASVPSFRNDLIVRGGSPNENRFYLDGIEVPNINHFATQGASGGPVGMLNVDFINEVDFYSGAFPANRGNALSSVLDLKYKDGRSDKPGATFTLGATDLATTFDGPLSKHSTLIASYRRSYLQFLFAALELPFLPTYNDFQFKFKVKPDNKQEFNFIGLGAYDDFVLNKKANKTEEQQYLLNNLPENTQWNYTLGGSYKKFNKNSFLILVLSRNHLHNRARKFQNNDESANSNKILDYISEEIENKFRVEQSALINNWKFNSGISFEQVTYTNSTFNRIPNIGTIDYSSRVDFLKYGAFGQISKTLPGFGLLLSAGARLDGNSFGDAMNNPLDQFSPRLSLSKTITEKITFNANSGLYFQVPAYTILGFRNNENELVNQQVKYIRSLHLVTGFEYQNKNNLKITLEGFIKIYINYPFGLGDSISIANQGSDFGVIGDEPVDSRSQGRAYGIELLYQQKLFKGFYGLFSYTFVKSEFTNLQQSYTPSSWDFRHIISMTAGKTFYKNWEAGVRFRFNSGSPFTPYDQAASSLRENWDITGQGILDVKRLNQNRTNAFHQLDIRIDKKYYFGSWTLDIFLDIQNVYNQVTNLSPNINVIRDSSGNPIVNPADPSRYVVKELNNPTGTIIPSIGVIVSI